MFKRQEYEDLVIQSLVKYDFLGFFFVTVVHLSFIIIIIIIILLEMGTEPPF